MPDFNTSDTISSLDQEAANLRAYLDQLRNKPMPAPAAPRTAPPEPTLNDLVKQKFIENTARLNALRQGNAPAASPSPSPPPNQPGSFAPSQAVIDYLKNRVTPGTFQPSQWVKRPPAPTSPQPGTDIVPYRGGAMPIPNASATPPQGQLIPNASGALPRAMPVSGGAGMGAAQSLGRFGNAMAAPILGIASQRDYSRYTPQQLAAGLAAWRAKNQPPAPAPTTVPIQKDQSRMPMTPAWTGMIPSPAMAQARPAPQAWSTPTASANQAPNRGVMVPPGAAAPPGVPSRHYAPQLPIPRPRPQIPVARPGVGGKGATPVQAPQPAVLDQILRALLGNPANYNQQAVNNANR